MKWSRFIALSDVYGKITSIALIMLLTINPSSIEPADIKTLQDIANDQFSATFQAFDSDCSFTILAYYDAYSPHHIWDPTISKGKSTGSLQQESEVFTTHMTENEDNIIPTDNKFDSFNNHSLYIPTFPEPIVYKNDAGQQITILPVDIDQFRLVEGLDTYAPDKWIQDRFTVLRDADNEPVLLEPINYATPGTMTANNSIADHVALMRDLALKPSAYKFVGGNILVVDTSYAFIKIEHRLPGAEKAFKQLLGVHSICWLGIPSHQYVEGWSLQTRRDPCSIYNDRGQHIDMYVTPAGKDNTGKELILVGRVEDYCLLQSIKNPDHIEAHNRMKCINDYLDTLQEQIERCSPEFVVQRLPLVLEEQTNGGFALRTYNNCITEIYVDTLSHRTIKRIYLPDYTSTLSADNRFITIQNKVTERLTAYGFNDVRWVRKDFLQATDSEGSLHCLVKVLSRTPYMR